MTSARDRFLAHPKLLEHTLLHLPLDTLLAAQLVCHAWLTLTTHSLLIQRALFRAPLELPILQPRITQHHHLAPSSAHMTQDSMHSECHGVYDCICGRTHAPVYAGHTPLNPFLAPWMRTQRTRLGYKSQQSEVLIVSSELVARIQRHAALRDMLVIQPQSLPGQVRVSARANSSAATLLDPVDLTRGVTGAQLLALVDAGCRAFAAENPGRGVGPDDIWVYVGLGRGSEAVGWRKVQGGDCGWEVLRRADGYEEVMRHCGLWWRGSAVC
ncbi:hypothetical protein LTR36_001447 [Oleoguttula mirabilis]|uniref:F-box domain-containing protein n=1 Tax=Oleoguttula mirabilis TaxID=1507867 RepID=A0AAV9JPB9_9PEZI|nr:hypothetical protein LTR36_001447 [Oleoguttula mirabilis]